MTLLDKCSLLFRLGYVNSKSATASLLLQRRGLSDCAPRSRQVMVSASAVFAPIISTSLQLLEIEVEPVKNLDNYSGGQHDRVIMVLNYPPNPLAMVSYRATAKI